MTRTLLTSLNNHELHHLSDFVYRLRTSPFDRLIFIDTRLLLLFSASGKIVLEKLAQETKASILSNLTNIVDGLDLIRDDLYKINELTEKLHRSSSLLDVG